MSEEMIRISVTDKEAQYLSVLAHQKRDEATLIMCDEIVEGGAETGQVTLANRAAFEDYMSLIRRTISERMPVTAAPNTLLTKMSQMIRR